MKNRSEMTVIVTFSVKITERDITRILTQAAETCDYWSKGIKQLGAPKGNTIGTHLLNGGQVYVYEKNGKYHQLTVQKLQNGFQLWFQNYSAHFNSMTLFSENRIMLNQREMVQEDADEIIQYAIFGKIAERK